MNSCLRCVEQIVDTAVCRRKDDDDEIRRYRKNWMILHTSSLLLGISYTIVLSSQHQFVTNPQHPDKPNVLKGLGESEAFYSYTIAILNIGELVGSLVFSIFSGWNIKLKHLLILGIVSLITGGLLYGLAQYGWMVLLGRLLQGFYVGGQGTLFRVYLGETSNTVRELMNEDPGISQLKNMNFVISFTFVTFGVALGPVLSAIMAQIPIVDQFRWSGWFFVFSGILLFLLISIFFKENWTDLKRTGQSCKISSALSGIAIPYYCLTFFVIAFFISNCIFGIIETLQNPILGDNFGMTVKWTSYIFIGSTIVFPISNFTILVLHKFGWNNRHIFLLGLSLSVVGCLILTDWQAIGGDPCDQFSGPCTNQSLSVETSVNDTNGVMGNASLSGCEICRINSGDPYHCFWNPDARISHKFCADCRPLCRGKGHTLNFAQFVVGIAIFTYSFPLQRIAGSIIYSDALGSASQSVLMGVLVCSGALGRATSPIWADAAYVAAGYHTYLPLLILEGLLLVVLVLYLIWFRKLRPRHFETLEVNDCSSTEDSSILERLRLLQ